MKVSETAGGKREQLRGIAEAIAAAVNERVGVRWVRAEFPDPDGPAVPLFGVLIEFVPSSPSWLHWGPDPLARVDVSPGEDPFLFAEIGKIDNRKSIIEKAGTFPVDAAAKAIVNVIHENKQEVDRRAELWRKREALASRVAQAGIPGSVSFKVSDNGEAVQFSFIVPARFIERVAVMLRNLEDILAVDV